MMKIVFFQESVLRNTLSTVIVRQSQQLKFHWWLKMLNGAVSYHRHWLSWALWLSKSKEKYLSCHNWQESGTLLQKSKLSPWSGLHSYRPELLLVVTCMCHIGSNSVFSFLEEDSRHTRLHIYTMCHRGTLLLNNDAPVLGTIRLLWQTVNCQDWLLL
jgi:hypothetical protein